MNSLFPLSKRHRIIFSPLDLRETFQGKNNIFQYFELLRKNKFCSILPKYYYDDEHMKTII